MRRLMNSNMGGGGMGQVSGQMSGQMSGFNQQQMPNWQQKNQMGQQQQSVPMSHLQPQNYGGQPGGGNSFGNNPMSNQNWGVNQYPMVSSPNSGGYQLDQTMTPRQSSLTPAPQLQPQGNSPPTQQPSLNEFELFNWAGGQ